MPDPFTFSPDPPSGTPDEQQQLNSRALSLGLLGAGLSILAQPRGTNLREAIGRGGMEGVESYTGYLANAAKLRHEQFEEQRQRYLADLQERRIEDQEQHLRDLENKAPKESDTETGIDEYIKDHPGVSRWQARQEVAKLRPEMALPFQEQLADRHEQNAEKLRQLDQQLRIKLREKFPNIFDYWSRQNPGAPAEDFYKAQQDPKFQAASRLLDYKNKLDVQNKDHATTLTASLKEKEARDKFFSTPHTLGTGANQVIYNVAPSPEDPDLAIWTAQTPTTGAWGEIMRGLGLTEGAPLQFTTRIGSSTAVAAPGAEAPPEAPGTAGTPGTATRGSGVVLHGVDLMKRPGMLPKTLAEFQALPGAIQNAWLAHWAMTNDPVPEYMKDAGKGGPKASGYAEGASAGRTVGKETAAPTTPTPTPGPTPPGFVPMTASAAGVKATIGDKTFAGKMGDTYLYRGADGHLYPVKDVSAIRAGKPASKVTPKSRNVRTIGFNPNAPASKRYQAKDDAGKRYFGPTSDGPWEPG